MPSPFDLPEVAAAIFEYLDQLSLANCIRVCKSWNTHCLPLLWRSIHLTLYRPSTIYEFAEQDYNSLDACTHNNEQDHEDRTIYKPGHEVEMGTRPADYCFQLEHIHLKNIRLNGGHYEGLLHSILKRFKNLRSLTFDKSPLYTTPVLRDDILSHPHLRDLCIAHGTIRVTDKHYAELLAAGGSNRWRRIDLPYLGPNTVAVLANHADTLEYLDVIKTSSSMDQSLVDLLASCTRLRFLNLHQYEFDAYTFIDYTNDTIHELEQQQHCQLLRPWKCEKTLIGKPRDEEGVCLSEIYPGQSHELQEQVMTRLGRFHNLQHIQLGLEDLTEDVRQRIKNSANHQGPLYDDPSYQYECLDMTLENGLGMLHQLRQLRHLNVGRMASRIGPKEVEWMIEHWPRLRVIEGLCPNEESKVKSKFQELTPHIQAIEFLPII
ncbi:hypothetical protein BGW42_001968 [Actinomortierella wolfii]|nr:hypothetical protein BGW42_001968 [Actinomortierella wolfii]